MYWVTLIMAIWGLIFGGVIGFVIGDMYFAGNIWFSITCAIASAIYVGSIIQVLASRKIGIS